MHAYTDDTLTYLCVVDIADRASWSGDGGLEITSNML